MSWQTASEAPANIPDSPYYSHDTMSTFRSTFASSEDMRQQAERWGVGFERAQEHYRVATYGTGQRMHSLYGDPGVVGARPPHYMPQPVLPRVSSNGASPQQRPVHIAGPFPTMSLDSGFNTVAPHNEHQVVGQSSVQHRNAALNTPWAMGRQPTLRHQISRPVQSFPANPETIGRNDGAPPAGAVRRLMSSYLPTKDESQVSFIPPRVPATGFLTIMNNYDPANVFPFLMFLGTLKSPSFEHGKVSEPDEGIEEDCGPHMNAWLLSLLPKDKAVLMFRSLPKSDEDDRSLLARCIRYAQSESVRKLSWAAHPTHVALIMERTDFHGTARNAESL